MAPSAGRASTNAVAQPAAWIGRCPTEPDQVRDTDAGHREQLHDHLARWPGEHPEGPEGDGEEQRQRRDLGGLRRAGEPAGRHGGGAEQGAPTHDPEAHQHRFGRHRAAERDHRRGEHHGLRHAQQEQRRQ